MYNASGPIGESKRQAKVFLIGGRGFIGGHICRSLLARGYRVRVFSTSDGPLANLADLGAEQIAAIEVVRGELGDRRTVQTAIGDSRYLIHAAIPYPVYSIGWKRRWVQERIALRSVLEAARDTGVKRSIFMSVSGTIGRSSEGLADESQAYHTPARTSLEMKNLAEQEVLRFVSEGLPAIIVNPCLCVGDSDTKPSSGQFLLDFLRLPVRFLEDCPINIADVRDVAEGTVLALERGKIGHRYLLGNDNTTVGSFAARVRRLGGHKGPTIPIPTSLLVCVSLASEVWGLMTRQSQPRIPLMGIDLLRYGSQHYRFDKAQQELGLPQSSVDDAIERGLLWFRENGYLAKAPRRTAVVV